MSSPSKPMSVNSPIKEEDSKIDTNVNAGCSQEQLDSTPLQNTAPRATSSIECEYESPCTDTDGDMEASPSVSPKSEACTKSEDGETNLNLSYPEDINVDGPSTNFYDHVIIKQEPLSDEYSDDEATSSSHHSSVHSDLEKICTSEDNPNAMKEFCKKVPCPKCSNEFTNAASESHIICKHETEHVCHLCGIKKANYKQMYMHIHYHHNVPVHLYKCKLCDYTTKYPSTIRRHHESHLYQSGEKQKSHKCEVCGKMFVSVDTLRKHMPIHAEIKPYTCQYCNKDYIQKNNLRLHIMKHHSDPTMLELMAKTGTRTKKTVKDGQFKRMQQFQCEICKKLFRWKHDMKRHMNSLHLGKNPYQCTDCDRTFPDKSALAIHVKSAHLKEKDYQCPYCYRQYFSKYKLTAHIKKNHKGKPCQIEDQVEGGAESVVEAASAFDEDTE